MDCFSTMQKTNMLTNANGTGHQHTSKKQIQTRKFSIFQKKYVTHASRKKPHQQREGDLYCPHSITCLMWWHVITDEPQAWKCHQLDVYKKIASVAFQVTKLFGCIFNEAKLKHTQTRHISTEGFKSRDRGKKKKKETVPHRHQLAPLELKLADLR